MRPLEGIDLALSQGSGFAESLPLLAKVDATFSLAAEVLSSRGGAAFAAADSSTSLSDDTVSRRVLELFLHQMRTGRLGAARSSRSLHTQA